DHARLGRVRVDDVGRRGPQRAVEPPEGQEVGERPDLASEAAELFHLDPHLPGQLQEVPLRRRLPTHDEARLVTLLAQAGGQEQDVDRWTSDVQARKEADDSRLPGTPRAGVIVHGRDEPATVYRGRPSPSTKSTVIGTSGKFHETSL